MDGYGMHTCCRLPIAGCRLSTNVESIWNSYSLPTERKSPIRSYCLLNPSTESVLVASKATQGLGRALGYAYVSAVHAMQKAIPCKNACT